MSVVPQVQVGKVVAGPLRAVQHLARWVVWHTVGVSLLPEHDGKDARHATRREAA